MPGGKIFRATMRSSCFLARFIDRAHAAVADEFEDLKLREKRRQFRQARRNESLGRALRDGVFRGTQFEQAGGAKARQRARLERPAALRTFRSVCRVLIHLAFIHTVSSEANHDRCDALPKLLETRSANRYSMVMKTVHLPGIIMPALAVPAAAMLLTFAAASSAHAQSIGPYLTHAASPAKPPATDGFLQGGCCSSRSECPFAAMPSSTDSFVQTNLKKDYFPNQFTVIPHDGDKVTVGSAELAWHAVDTSTYNVNLYHFAYALGKPTYNVVFWAVTIVNCPQEMRNVRLAVGSNAASIWWVNGKEVIDLYGDRHMIVDDGVSKRLTLNKGPNVVRCAVINAPGVVISAPVFSTSRINLCKGSL